MSLLRKTGESQYDVLVDEQTIGQVWNWHGSWSAQAYGKVRLALDVLDRRPFQR